MLEKILPAQSYLMLLLGGTILILLGCQDTPDVQQLTPEQSGRQINIIAEYRSNGGYESFIGQTKNELKELISLADEIDKYNGKLYYTFDRKGGGGNDDGSDAKLTLVFDGDVVVDYIDIAIDE